MWDTASNESVRDLCTTTDHDIYPPRSQVFFQTSQKSGTQGTFFHNTILLLSKLRKLRSLFVHSSSQKKPQLFSIGFKSGLLESKRIISRFFFMNHLFVALAVRMEVFFCWKIHFTWSMQHANGSKYSPSVLVYIVAFWSPTVTSNSDVLFSQNALHPISDAPTS